MLQYIMNVAVGLLRDDTISFDPSNAEVSMSITQCNPTTGKQWWCHGATHMLRIQGIGAQNKCAHLLWLSVQRCVREVEPVKDCLDLNIVQASHDLLLLLLTVFLFCQVLCIHISIHFLFWMLGWYDLTFSWTLLQISVFPRAGAFVFISVSIPLGLSCWPLSFLQWICLFFLFFCLFDESRVELTALWLSSVLFGCMFTFGFFF